MTDLDLTADLGALTAALVDIESVSGSEQTLADAVERGLSRVEGLEVIRDGDAVVARTHCGYPGRVLLAGHLDTVPVAGNLPSRVEGGRLFGCGTTDMKSGLAVLLRIAATPPDMGCNLTVVCYDHEEVQASANGLGRIARQRPDLLKADLALLLEPTDGVVEAGCQGTIRATVTTTGVRAHSARSWLGRNAVHAASAVLERLSAYPAREVQLDGCTYREGLQAVRISGGVAGNVVPDECVVTVNFRFAPDRTLTQAEEHVREVFAGWPVEVTDAAPAAPPGLSAPLAAAFVAASGEAPRAKLGWTDVARFAELGIPAVNIGPGDPALAHTVDESVELARITAVDGLIRAFLSRR